MGITMTPMPDNMATAPNLEVSYGTDIHLDGALDSTLGGALEVGSVPSLTVLTVELMDLVTPTDLATSTASAIRYTVHSIPHTGPQPLAGVIRRS